MQSVPCRARVPRRAVLCRAWCLEHDRFAVPCLARVPRRAMLGFQNAKDVPCRAAPCPRAVPCACLSRDNPNQVRQFWYWFSSSDALFRVSLHGVIALLPKPWRHDDTRPWNCHSLHWSEAFETHRNPYESTGVHCNTSETLRIQRNPCNPFPRSLVAPKPDSPSAAPSSFQAANCLPAANQPLAAPEADKRTPPERVHVQEGSGRVLVSGKYKEEHTGRSITSRAQEIQDWSKAAVGQHDTVLLLVVM